MNGAPSYVELRFFTPFDINKIPDDILESVYEEAVGQVWPRDINIIRADRLILRELLLCLCDEKELIRCIRRKLIKYYSQ